MSRVIRNYLPGEIRVGSVIASSVRGRAVCLDAAYEEGSAFRRVEERFLASWSGERPAGSYLTFERDRVGRTSALCFHKTLFEAYMRHARVPRTRVSRAELRRIEGVEERVNMGA